MAGCSIAEPLANEMRIQQRTNNILQGRHSKVKKIASKHHLNHSEILDLFKKEQALMDSKFRQLMAGWTRRQAPHRRNKDFELQTALTTTPSQTI